ncbi:hypothetical protein MN608_10843 [Microdochium nivale]|nr:hypothetical protein MN608_10843 [Microdochium nivale]
MDRITNLPRDVLEPMLLGSAYSRSDLRPLRLVSKTFNEIVKAEFWRCIHVPDYIETRHIAQLIRALENSDDGASLVRKLIVSDNSTPGRGSRYQSLLTERNSAWLTNAYSQGFTDWFVRLSLETDGTPFSFCLALLIAHMPNLEALCLGAKTTYDRHPLLPLFDHCSASRTAHITDGTIARLPLQKLMEVDLIAYWGLWSQCSATTRFPLERLDINLSGPELFKLKLKPTLPPPEVLELSSDTQTLHEVLAAFTSLKTLTFEATEEDTIDFSLVGRALRDCGCKLEEIVLRLWLSPESLTAVVGQVGDLHRLSSLKTLAIPAEMLLGANQQSPSLTTVLPTSIQLLAITNTCHLYETRKDLRGKIEHEVCELLQYDHKFSSLRGIGFEWLADSMNVNTEWHLTQDEEMCWSWFARDGTDSNKVFMLLKTALHDEVPYRITLESAAQEDYSALRARAIAQ